MKESGTIKRIECSNCPLQKLNAFRDLSTSELAFMTDFKQGEFSVDKRTHVLVEFSISPHVYTVLSGILIRFKTLEDGRRQIVNYVFPGDLLGLQGAMHEPLTHGVEAMTDVKLCVFSRDRMIELFAQQPKLGFDMTWLVAKEEAALDEHLLALGQRTAKERIAYLALFLFLRGQETGMTKGNVLELAITQEQIADTVGLSLVHTNRTLQWLRKSGILTWTTEKIEIPDMPRAIDMAQYDHGSRSKRPFI